MAQSQGQSAVRIGLTLGEPELFDVIMLNDDFTTMEFVVMVLATVFYHTEAEAETMMMEIHQSGSCVVGTFVYDIAFSKAQKATELARKNGFPLRLKIKEREA